MTSGSTSPARLEALERIPGPKKSLAVTFNQRPASSGSLDGASPQQRPASAVSGGAQRRRLQDALQASATSLSADASAHRGSQVIVPASVIPRRSLKSSVSAPGEIGNLTVEARMAARKSKSKRPATAGAFIRSVSPVTQRQNGKTQMLLDNMDVEECGDFVSNMASPSADASAEVQVFTLLSSEQFEKELKSFEGTLSQMGRRIRMEGFADAKTRKKMEEDSRRAAEQKVKDEKTRKLRQAAKEAQNPKRRVWLRVEQQRLASDADIVTKVPMRKLEATGGYGTLSIPMVDVHKLQATSLGLNVGAGNFNAINELFCDHERRQAWEMYALGPQESREDHMKKNKSEKSLMSRTAKVVNDRIFQSQHAYDQRERQAQTRRRKHYEEKSLQLLSACRMGVDLNQPPALMSPALKEMVAQAAEEIRTGVAPEGQSRMHRRLSGQLGGSSPSSKAVADEQASPLLPRRNAGSGGHGCSFWWGVIRGVVGMIMLFHRLRARSSVRNWAADGVRQFLVQVERVALLKARARHLKNKVVKIQNLCRCFLIRKNYWIKGNTALWAGIEDAQLQTYLLKMLKEAGGAFEARKDPFASSPSRGADNAAPLTKQAFRIPVAHRKFALGRWYVRQLRKKLQAHEDWLETIQTGVSQRKDIEQFYTLCGFEYQDTDPGNRAAAAGGEEANPKMDLTGLFVLDEQEIIDLIVTSAHELRDSEVAPFQKHWACIIPKFAKGAGSRIAKMQRRMSMAQGTPDGTVTKQAVAEDLEDVFDKFTPRLRQIREAPATVEIGVDLVADALPTS